MIMIYSADAKTGRLYTDPKQHFYIDGELLREHAVTVRTVTVMNHIAVRLGYKSFEDLKTSAKSAGITLNVLLYWILNGRFEYINAMTAYLKHVGRGRC